jgi:LysM repeat protein
MAYQIFRYLGVGCITVLIAGCSGGAGPSRPDGPSWSLNDEKPQGLGYASPQPANRANQAASPYEYRGGRDPVTGQAGAVQGSPVVGKSHFETPATTPLRRAALTAAGSPGVSAQVEVRKGDTLHGLSLQHHVSVNALMAANNLTNAKIRLGQKLVIPLRL